jgi:hypothetical protein
MLSPVAISGHLESSVTSKLLPKAVPALTNVGGACRRVGAADAEAPAAIPTPGATQKGVFAPPLGSSPFPWAHPPPSQP